MNGAQPHAALSLLAKSAGRLTSLAGSADEHLACCGMPLCAALVRSDGATTIGKFSKDTSANPNRWREKASETVGNFFLLFFTKKLTRVPS